MTIKPGDIVCGATVLTELRCRGKIHYGLLCECGRHFTTQRSNVISRVQNLGVVRCRDCAVKATEPARRRWNREVDWRERC